MCFVELRHVLICENQKKKSIPRCTTKQFVFFCFWFDPDVTSSTVIVGAPEEEETAEGGGVALGLPASSGYCQ